MSNLGLERVLDAEGITLARTDVGDRYVLEEMLRSGSVLGGEQSGHIIFLDDSPAGDGLLTALKIASLVSMNGGLADLTKGLKDYPQIIVNVKVRSKPPLDSLPEVSRASLRRQLRAGPKWTHSSSILRHGAARTRNGGSRTRFGCATLQPVASKCCSTPLSALRQAFP